MRWYIRNVEFGVNRSKAMRIIDNNFNPNECYYRYGVENCAYLLSSDEGVRWQQFLEIVPELDGNQLSIPIPAANEDEAMFLATEAVSRLTDGSVSHNFHIEMFESSDCDGTNYWDVLVWPTEDDFEKDLEDGDNNRASLRFPIKKRTSKLELYD
jgi:hypothetical protein